MKEISEIINQIDTLTPISPIANQLLDLIDRPDSSMIEVIDIVSYDTSTTASLLKICNSAFFGLPRRVESVQQAVTLLGLNQIVELVIMSNIGKNLKKEQPGYSLRAGELWKQSVATALLAKSIAQKRNMTDIYRIFTGALLRDIGKVVLDRYVEKSFNKIDRLVLKKGLSFEEAENKIIGTDHATLGGMIADKWRFSAQMAYIISKHHLSDTEARKDRETSIVYLADTVSLMAGIGIGADGLAYKFYDEVFSVLNISESELHAMMVEYHSNQARARAMLEVT